MSASVCSSDMPPPISLIGRATLPSFCIFSRRRTGALTISSSMRSKPFLIADCTIGSTRSSSGPFAGDDDAPKRDQMDEDDGFGGAEGWVEYGVEDR